MIDTRLLDGLGNKRFAAIGAQGEVSVVVHPHPPISNSENSIPFRQYFKSEVDDSTDMRVNGSSTNIRFSISAIPNFDIYIKTISIVIADASQTLNEFGNLNSALTNGLLFEWETLDLGTTTISDELKTNFDFIRLAQGNPSFGSGASAFLANNVISTSEAYLPVIDFSAIFGTPFGLKLRRDSIDKLVFTIRDNLTGVDQFDAIGYGIKI